jgi:hypothetical protein
VTRTPGLFQGERVLRDSRAPPQQHASGRFVSPILSAKPPLTVSSLAKPSPKLHSQSHSQRLYMRPPQGRPDVTTAAVWRPGAASLVLYPLRYHIPLANRGAHQRGRGQGELQGPEEQARLNSSRRYNRSSAHESCQLPQQSRCHIRPNAKGKSTTGGFLSPSQRHAL